MAAVLMITLIIAGFVVDSDNFIGAFVTLIAWGFGKLVEKIING